MKLNTDRRGRLELVADAPAQIPLDAGRAVVVPVRMVSQPIIRDRTVVSLGERKERYQVPPGRALPGVRRPITAAGEQHPPVGREDDGLGLLKVPEKLRELFGHLKKTQSIVFSADGRMLFAGGSYGTTNAWEGATGRHLVTLFAFPKTHNGTVTDDWLAYHPDGYYDGSPGVERYLGWRVGDEFKTPASIGVQLHRPDRLAAALQPGVRTSGSR